MNAYGKFCTKSLQNNYNLKGFTHISDAHFIVPIVQYLSPNVNVINFHDVLIFGLGMLVHRKSRPTVSIAGQ